MNFLNPAEKKGHNEKGQAMRKSVSEHMKIEGPDPPRHKCSLIRVLTVC